MDWGGLLGGFGSLLGGIGGFFRGGSGHNWAAENFAREQLQFQREAARHGISWRVADAKESGIHPLYALGSPGFNPSPVSFPVGDADAGVDVGGALAKMSQGVGRAIEATRTKEEREESAYDLITKQQQMENNQLNNELLRARIASEQALLTRNQIGPPMASAVKGASGGSPNTAATQQSEIKPNEITSSQPDAPSAAAGPVAPSNQWRIAPDGAVYPTPEKNLQMDDMGSPGWLPWMYRNHVLPYAKQIFKGSESPDVQQYAPPMHMLPKGAVRWVKQPDGSWLPVDGSGHRVVSSSHRFERGRPVSLRLPPRY